MSIADRVIELNRNELSYPPPVNILEAAREGVTGAHQYLKVTDLQEIKRKLAAYTRVAEPSILIGSGVEILIAQALQLFSRKGKVIILDPTFFMITQIAESLETRVLKIRLTEPAFSLPFDLLVEEARDSALVVIDSPNNPTGKLLLERRLVSDLCQNSAGILLIDESYYEFCRFSVIDMVKDYPNLVVTRTMSKAFGLAGLKLGYMVASESVLRNFASVELALRPTRPSVYAASAALKDTSYVDKMVTLVTEERERVSREASDIGATVYPSSANF